MTSACHRRAAGLRAGRAADHARAVVDDVTTYAQCPPRQCGTRRHRGRHARLRFAAQLDRERDALPKTAYLQYTSGSTRHPAGVVISHENVIANLAQVLHDYFDDHGGTAERHHVRVVAALLPRHGPDHGCLRAAGRCGRPRGADEPAGVPAASPPAGCSSSRQHPRVVPAAPNFAFELAVAPDLRRRHGRASISGDVLGIISGAERVHSATIRRFNERFAPLQPARIACAPLLRAGRGDAVRAISAPGRRPSDGAVRLRETVGRTRQALRRGEGSTELVSYGAPRSTHRAHRRPRDPASRTRPGKVGEIWVHGDNVAAAATGGNRSRRDAPFGGRVGRSVRRARRRAPGCGPETWASSPTASCSSSAGSRIC